MTFWPFSFFFKMKKILCSTFYLMATGMSNVEDSSSLEYLDESQYLEEDDHYTQFLLPPVPPQRLQSKTVQQQQQQQSQQHHLAQAAHHRGGGGTGNFANSNCTSAAVPADAVVVEPEYTEADPGGLGITAGHFYRSVTDGPLPATLQHAATPTGSAPSTMLMTSGSSSSLRPRPKESAMHQSNSLYSPVMDRAGPFGVEASFRSTLETPSSASIQSASLQRSPSSVCANKQVSLKGSSNFFCVFRTGWEQIGDDADGR